MSRCCFSRRVRVIMLIREWGALWAMASILLKLALFVINGYLCSTFLILCLPHFRESSSCAKECALKSCEVQGSFVNYPRHRKVADAIQGFSCYLLMIKFLVDILNDWRVKLCVIQADWCVSSDSSRDCSKFVEKYRNKCIALTSVWVLNSSIRAL